MNIGAGELSCFGVSEMGLMECHSPARCILTGRSRTSTRFNCHPGNLPGTFEPGEGAVFPGPAFVLGGEGFVRCQYATNMQNLTEAMVFRIQRFLKRLGYSSFPFPHPSSVLMNGHKSNANQE